MVVFTVSSFVGNPVLMLNKLGGFAQSLYHFNFKCNPIYNVVSHYARVAVFFKLGPIIIASNY